MGCEVTPDQLSNHGFKTIDAIAQSILWARDVFNKHKSLGADGNGRFTENQPPPAATKQEGFKEDVAPEPKADALVSVI